MFYCSCLLLSLLLFFLSHDFHFGSQCDMMKFALQNQRVPKNPLICFYEAHKLWPFDKMQLFIYFFNCKKEQKKSRSHNVIIIWAHRSIHVTHYFQLFMIFVRIHCVERIGNCNQKQRSNRIEFKWKKFREITFFFIHRLLWIFIRNSQCLFCHHFCGSRDSVCFVVPRRLWWTWSFLFDLSMLLFDSLIFISFLNNKES